MARLTCASVAMAIGLGVFGVTHALPAHAGPSAAQNDANFQWKAFRNGVSAHSQVTGISRPYPDGSRLIILAEPSPSLDAETIGRDLGSIDANILTARTRVGVDGWVRDTLLCIPKVSDQQLATLLAKLSLDAYGTTYQSVPVSLPLTTQAGAPDAPLDLSISATDLGNWLLNDRQQTFSSILSAAQQTLSELISGKNYGDYVSGKPGLTFLLLPRRVEIDRFRTDIARFTRESDVILAGC